MADIMIRDVDDVAVQKMLEAAAATGRPLDVVARDVLLGALHASPEERLAKADRVRAMTPAQRLAFADDIRSRPTAEDSADLIRRDRDAL